jgi:hypothetical protein
MVDIGFGADEFEGVGAEQLSVAIASLISGTAEPPAPGVVKWMPLLVSTVWPCTGPLRSAAEGGLQSCVAWLLDELDKGEFAGPVDVDEHAEPALGGTHFGEVDVEEAGRVALELGLRGALAFDLRQAADAVTLQAAMQRRARQARMVGCRA